MTSSEMKVIIVAVVIVIMAAAVVAASVAITSGVTTTFYGVSRNALLLWCLDIIGLSLILVLPNFVDLWCHRQSFKSSPKLLSPSPLQRAAPHLLPWATWPPRLRAAASAADVGMIKTRRGREGGL